MSDRIMLGIAFVLAGLGIFVTNQPDMAEVQRLLGNALLAKLSAHNFRHVLNGAKRICSRAGKANDLDSGA